MTKLIPTINTDSIVEFSKQVKQLYGLSHRIQVDFADGEFVEWSTIRPEDISNLDLPESIELEAHLMVDKPVNWIKNLPKQFVMAVPHLEAKDALEDWPEWYELALEKSIRLAIAINPETDLEKILNLNPKPEMMLVMGVNPGRSGQTMLESTPSRIAKVASEYPGTIGVDGGVRSELIQGLAKAGANQLYVGSALTSSQDYRASWQELTRNLNK